MLPKLPVFRRSLVALAAVAAALLAPAPARATRGDAGAPGPVAVALPSAPALAAAEGPGPAREMALPDGHAAADALAYDAAPPSYDEPTGHELSRYDLPTFLNPPAADRYDAVSGLSLLDRGGANGDFYEYDATRQLVAEITRPKSRVRVFSVLGSPVACRSDDETYTWTGLSARAEEPDRLELFPGAWTDPTTGLAYHRARWYDPRTASWLSEDPEGDVDSPNLYAFVGWGPHSGIDPMGLARGASALQAVFGCGQIAGGVAATVGSGGLGTAGGVLLVAHGAPDCLNGIKGLLTDEYEENPVREAIRGAWQQQIQAQDPGATAAEVEERADQATAITESVVLTTAGGMVAADPPGAGSTFVAKLDDVLDETPVVPPAPKPKPPVDKSWKNKIVGEAQKTGTPGHQFRTYREAISEAKKAEVTSVHLDHGYNRALGLDRKAIAPNRRPDVIALYDDFGVARVEVQSRTDVPAVLRSRNAALDAQLKARGFQPKPPRVVVPTRKR